MVNEKVEQPKLEVILVTEPLNREHIMNLTPGVGNLRLGGLVMGQASVISSEMEKACNDALTNLKADAQKKGYDYVFDVRFQPTRRSPQDCYCLCTGTGYIKN